MSRVSLHSSMKKSDNAKCSFGRVNYFIYFHFFHKNGPKTPYYNPIKWDTKPKTSKLDTYTFSW